MPSSLPPNELTPPATVISPSQGFTAPKESLLLRLGRATRSLLLQSRWLAPLTLFACGILLALRWQLTIPTDNESPRLIREAFLALLPGLVLMLVRVRGWARLGALAVICGTSAYLWVTYDLAANAEEATMNYIGATPVPDAYWLKILLVFLGILSPIPVALLYQRASILDRYLVRQFTAPFLFCVIAFFAIWLIFDLNDNLPDFREGNREGHASMKQILAFYGLQIPHVFTMIAQAAVLISTVYALSRMSRANEFIAILGSGRSLWRTLLPLFMLGFYISFLYLVFNYEWAPRAEGKKESILDQFGGNEKSSLANRHLYVNESANRLWFIGTIPFDLRKEGGLRTIDIYEFTPESTIRRSIQADTASWDWKTKHWHFHQAHIITPNSDPNKAPLREPHEPNATPIADYEVLDWPETPWQLTNQRINPDYLGVQGLESYIRTKGRDAEEARPFLTSLHYRWAAPWSCLAILFVAAPLGIVFSRRGILGGVASAIFFFGATLFLTELFLALGKGGYLAPALAAWLANGIFFVLGSIFLYLRARNRSVRLPRLRPVKLAAEA